MTGTAEAEGLPPNFGSTLVFLNFGGLELRGLGSFLGVYKGSFKGIYKDLGFRVLGFGLSGFL